jgi:hypothetical protein
MQVASAEERRGANVTQMFDLFRTPSFYNLVAYDALLILAQVSQLITLASCYM